MSEIRVTPCDAGELLNLHRVCILLNSSYVSGCMLSYIVPHAVEWIC